MGMCAVTIGVCICVLVISIPSVFGTMWIYGKYLLNKCPNQSVLNEDACCVHTPFIPLAYPFPCLYFPIKRSQLEPKLYQ